MAKQIYFSLLLLISFKSITQAHADTCLNSTRRLFVFGDSYLDTGNAIPQFASWRPPYGESIGKPSGRYSDGLVWTDLLASFMGLDPLTPYASVDASNLTTTRNGVNFAVSSSSVFRNPFNYTMDVYMNQFRELAKGGAFNLCDIKNSIAFVSITINDYFYKNATIPYPPYTVAVVAQLAANLQILRTFGIEKIAVASLPPMGCLPQFATGSAFPGNCNQAMNEVSRRHNNALRAAVDVLNMANKEKSIEYVDFFGGFLAAMDEHTKTVSKEYSNPTKPCCVGLEGHWCGDVGEDGKPLYKLCNEPLESFFWDGLHPAQHGWQLVFDALKEDIKKLLA